MEEAPVNNYFIQEETEYLVQSCICVKHIDPEVIACLVCPGTRRRSEWLSIGVRDGARKCELADVRDSLVMGMSLASNLLCRVQCVEGWGKNRTS